jgi:urease accessory protein
MLNVLRALAVAREAWREAEIPDHARAYRRDTITLGWEDRLKTRARRRSDGGIEFATALPRGTMLREGDCLVLDPVSMVVVVIEREEPVYVVEARDAAECGLFAYYIGNSHQPVMIAAGAIVCPDVAGMEQVLEQHRIPFTRGRRRFTPVGMCLDHRH